MFKLLVLCVLVAAAASAPADPPKDAAKPAAGAADAAAKAADAAKKGAAGLAGAATGAAGAAKAEGGKMMAEGGKAMADAGAKATGLFTKAEKAIAAEVPKVIQTLEEVPIAVKNTVVEGAKEITDIFTALFS